MTGIADDAPIHDLPCLGMMRNALRRAGYETAGDLRAASDAALMMHPGIGRGTVNKIRLHLGRERVSAWEPIETAPKDGEEFLAVHVYDDGSFTHMVAYWSDALGRPTWGEPFEEDRLPQHWMPLPEPPAR